MFAGLLATRLGREALPPCEILRLAGGEINFDGVNRGNGGDRPATWADEGAHLELCLSGDAVDGGNEAGEIEINPRGFNGGLIRLNLSLGRFHRGFGREVVLDGVVEILLAGGFLLCQWCVTVDVKLSPALHCFG